jgi:hypothetical protein
MYVITRRVEEKALEKKRRRERLLAGKRVVNLETYRRQYHEAEERKKNLDIAY